MVVVGGGVLAVGLVIGVFYYRNMAKA